MRKRIIALVFALLICLSLPVCASSDYFHDNADVLSESAEVNITEKISELNERYGIDTVVITENDLGGKSPRSFADSYYDDNGYSEDGVLFLLSFDTPREMYISTKGLGRKAITDDDVEYIFDDIEYYMQNGDYESGILCFLDLCDSYYPQGEAHRKFNFGTVVTALVIGAIGGLIGLGISKSKMKSVRRQDGAAEYMVPGSLNITLSRDVFLYHHLTRTPRPKNNSNSSGSSHGGGGRKF